MFWEAKTNFKGFIIKSNLVVFVVHFDSGSPIMCFQKIECKNIVSYSNESYPNGTHYIAHYINEKKNGWARCVSIQQMLLLHAFFVQFSLFIFCLTLRFDMLRDLHVLHKNKCQLCRHNYIHSPHTLGKHAWYMNVRRTIEVKAKAKTKEWDKWQVNNKKERACRGQ